MALKGCVVEGELLPFGQIPPDLLPWEIQIAFQKAKERVGLHLTDLTICPYRSVRCALQDYYLPVHTIYRMARGRAWDEFTQAHPRPEALYQYELERPLLGINIVGTPDVIDLARASIDDFKSPDRPYYKTPSGYIAQLNGYAYLADSFLRSLCGKGAQQLWLLVLSTSYKRIEVPLWPVQSTEEFLKRRLDLYQTLLVEEVASTCEDPTCVYCRSQAIFV